MSDQQSTSLVRCIVVQSTVSEVPFRELDFHAFIPSPEWHESRFVWSAPSLRSHAMHALSRHPRLLISKISASANPSSKTFPYGTSISSTRRRTVHSARCYCRLDADEELGNKSANTSSSASNRDGPSNIEAPNSPRSTIGSCTRAPGRIRERPSTREAVPGIRSCKRDAHFNGLQQGHVRRPPAAADDDVRELRP